MPMFKMDMYNCFQNLNRKFSHLKKLTLALIFSISVIGVWGADTYYLRNKNNDWENYQLWRVEKNGASRRDCTSGEYPNNATDTVYVDNTGTLTINSDITIGTLQGNQNIKIVVKSGNTFTIGKLQIEHNKSNTITIEVESGAKLILKDADNQNGNLQVTGDGELDLSEYQGASGELNLPGTTWTGATDSDWTVATNWTNGIPTATTIPVIPATVEAGRSMPVISSGTDVICAGIDIKTGGSLTVNGTLTLNASTTLSGIDSASEGKIISSGTITVDSDFSAPNLDFDVAGFVNSAEVECNDITAKSLSNTAKLTCKIITAETMTPGATIDATSITVSEKFETKSGIATFLIKCAGAFSCTNTTNETIIRNNIEATSVSIAGPVSFGANCNSITTTTTQVYKDKAQLLNKTTALNLIATTVTFNESLINWTGGDAATPKSIIIGDSSNATVLNLEKGAGTAASPLKDITAYGKVTALADIFCNDLSAEDNILSKAITCKNLTAKNDFETNAGAVTCTGDIKISGSAIFRGNVRAKSVTVSGTTTIGLATKSITTSGNQEYRAVKINTNSAADSKDHRFVATGTGSTITFNGAISAYTNVDDSKAEPNLLIGTRSSQKSNVIFKADVSEMVSIDVYGTATIDGATKISSTGPQTYEAIHQKSEIKFYAGDTTASTVTIGKITTEVENDITIGDGTTDSKATSAVFNGSIGTSTARVKALKVYGQTSFDATTAVSVFTKNGQEYGKIVTTNKPITFDISTATAKADFKAAFGTVTEKITVNGNADFAGDNTFTDLIIGSGSQTTSYTISFADDSTQTFTKITTNGIEDYPVTLTNITGTTNWKADVTPANASFAYTLINNSTATSSLAYIQDQATLRDAGLASGSTPTTENWFLFDYYWLGGTSTNWEEGTNWSYNGTTAITVSSDYPDYASGKSTIIAKGTTNDLILPGDISIASLTVLSGATVDFSTYSVTTKEITNNGTIKMSGENTLSALSPATAITYDQDDDSTIEYYGSFSSLPWNSNSYKNLVFSNSASGSYSTAITVAGTTTLNTTGDVSLTGANNFTGSVTITAAEDVSLTAKTGNSITIDGAVSCNTLTINAPVTLNDNITTSSTQTYNGKVTLEDDVEFDGQITLTKNLEIDANSHDIDFKTEFGTLGHNLKITNAGTNLNFTGSNEFEDLSISGPATVSFDASSFQKINGKLSLSGTDADTRLILGGANDWYIYFDKTKATLSYITVKKCSSKNYDNSDLNELGYTPTPEGILEFKAGSATAWFKHKYIWTGAYSTNWGDIDNWAYYVDADDPTNNIPAPVPAYVDSTAEIELNKTGTNDLELDGNSETTITLKSLKIISGNRFGLADKNLTTETLTNNGTFALHGTSSQTISVTANSHDTTSTIEYYGTGDSKDIFAASVDSDGNKTYKTLSITKSSGNMTFESTTATTSLNSDDTSATITFNKNFTSTNAAVFNQAVEVNSKAKTMPEDIYILTISAGTNTVTFNKNVTATNTDQILSLASPVVAEAKLQSKTIQILKALTINSTTPDDFKCDELIANGTCTLTIADTKAANLTDITVNSSKSLTTASSFIIGGNLNNSGSFSTTDGTGTITLKGNLNNTGTFNAAYGTILFAPTNAEIEITGNNTYKNLTIESSAALTVKFGAGQTQTVNGIFTVTGTGAKITLTTNAASPSTSDKTTWWTLGGVPAYDATTWATEPKVILSNVTIEYSKAANNLIHDWGNTVTEGEESSTANWFITIFYWWGTSDTKWETPANWSASEDDNTALSFYPPYQTNSSQIIIKDSSAKILKLENPVKLKSLTVNEDQTVDFATYEVNTKEITNNGTIRMQEGSSITPVSPATSVTYTQGDGSTIEYYAGDFTTLPWNANSYKNLVFSGSASVTNTDALTVAGTTTLNTTENVSLTGNNTFTGNITITAANDVTLTAKTGNSIPIAKNAKCNSLVLNSPAVLNGSVTTTNNQTYNENVKLNAGTTLKSSSGTIVIEKIIGDGSLAANATATHSLVLDGNVTFGSASKVNAKYLRASPSKNSTWTHSNPTDTINIATDLYLDTSHDLTLSENLSCKNLTLYKGNLIFTNITASGNFVAFGSAYSAVDPRYYNASNTRFGYYFATEPAYVPTGITYNEHELPLSGTSATLSGTSLSVTGNFYANGLNLSSIALKLADNSSSNPVFNSSVIPTADQWGTPYAVVFNSDISNVTVTKIDETEGTYLTAAKDGQKNKDSGGNNTYVQFDVPKIAEAKTVSDDVIYISFTMPLENSNGQIKTNLAKITTDEKAGGLWYNSGALKPFFATIYSDPACKTEIQNGDITTPDTNGNYGFYLKINTDGEKWNTDANGKLPWNKLAVTAGTESDSTDRSGTHHDITVDLTMLEGLFTAANGHTMSDDYGVNSTSPAFDGTTDECKPVLVAAYTGQENHVADISLQPAYDGHNFIELRYSEPVNISDGTTTLNSVKADGTSVNADENIRTTDALGHITGNGTGTGITPSANKGLTIAGLANLTHGQLNSASKSDSDSPHALYRKFATSTGSAAKAQTHRVRVSIAGYANTAGTYKDWLGYIDYAKSPTIVSSTPVGGTPDKSKVSAISNDFVKDLNGNQLDTSINTTGIELNKGITGETINAIYGAWDTLPPVFSQVRKIKNSDVSTYYEAIPTGDGSKITNIELHLLDGDYSANNQYFVFAFGWATKNATPDSEERYYTLINDSFKAADNFGGSRAFKTTAADRTGGGLRYSSIVGQKSAFKFTVDGTTFSTFDSITPGATSSFFSSGNPIPTTKDNPYISLELTNKTYSYDTVFSVSYDNTDSYITDLAGNRLRSTTDGNLITTIDRTPPDYNMSLASIGDDNLYLIFAKSLKTSDIKVGANTKSLLTEVLPDIVQFGRISGGFTQETGLSVESAEIYYPLTIKGRNDKDFTAIKLKLNRAITISDVKELYIRIKECDSQDLTSADPFTGLTTRVTYIQDDEGTTYLQMYKAHPLSDFAINAIVPEYAYDPEFTADDENIVMRNPLNETESGNWSVHSWGASQGNYGSLPVDDKVNLLANIPETDGTDYVLYMANKPTSASVSKQFNSDFSASKRIWLPEISGYAGFGPISDILNSSYITINAQDNSDPDAIDFDATEFPNRVEFKIDSKTNNYNWKAGDQISFLFALTNGGTPYTIMHNPTTTDGTSYTGASSPIFALRTDSISNPDITTLDLWSYRLKSFNNQRGGVTILNNVINVHNKEKSVIKVNMTKEGSLKVIIMTLDGNVVKYLENSNNTSGEHMYYWDGTNNKGNAVARGMYFVRVIGENLDETRKIICVNEK